MRKEPFTVGSYVHIIKRGTRQLPIVRDNHDRWRFLKLLCYFNDKYSNEFWEIELKEAQIRNTFKRPDHWPKKIPLVKILAFCLLDNHFHLLLQEIEDGGISLFMKKIGNSMTGCFNTKYGTSGSLFQGPYKARVVQNDPHLRYLSSYIMVKNVFEVCHNKNLNYSEDFDLLYDLSSKYPFCSLGHFLGKKNLPFVDKEILGEIFESKNEFKEYSKDVISGRQKADLFEKDKKEV